MTADAASPTVDVVTEPGWVQHAIWWRVYPLGFVDAYPEATSSRALPDEHRLTRLIGWLDHAVRLGASGVALGPIFASASHGYDTLDHLHIDPRLGTDADFDALVAQARRRGLRIQLDGVFNHVASTHSWVAEATSRPAHERRVRVDDGPDGKPELRLFEGHAGLVTLNHDSPEVRDHVVTVMRHWLDRGADSWRLDAAYAVPTEFWADVLPQVRRTHPDVWFEAEVIHGDYAGFVAGSTAYSVTQYELWKAIWSAINDRNFYELDWALRRHNELLQTFVPATFVGNHDVTRIASQLEDRRHLPHALVLLAMLGGTPAVYAGDEYALTAVKEHRAGGDDAIRPAFPGAPDELEHRDDVIFRLHQELLALRRRHPWLHRATSTTIELDNQRYRLRLDSDGNALEVHLNLSGQPDELPGGVEILAAGPHSSDGLQPHGWAVTTPS